MSVSQYQNTFTTDKTKTLGLKNFFPEIISGFYDNNNNNNRKTKRDTEQKKSFIHHTHTHAKNILQNMRQQICVNNFFFLSDIPTIAAAVFVALPE